MKKILSFSSFVIYSKEYRVANGHKNATNAEKTVDNPSTLRDIDKSPVNLIISQISPVLVNKT